MDLSSKARAITGLSCFLGLLSHVHAQCQSGYCSASSSSGGVEIDGKKYTCCSFNSKLCTSDWCPNTCSRRTDALEFRTPSGKAFWQISEFNKYWTCGEEWCYGNSIIRTLSRNKATKASVLMPTNGYDDAEYYIRVTFTDADGATPATAQGIYMLKGHDNCEVDSADISAVYSAWDKKTPLYDNMCSGGWRPPKDTLYGRYEASIGPLKASDKVCFLTYCDRSLGSGDCADLTMQLSQYMKLRSSGKSCNTDASRGYSGDLECMSGKCSGGTCQGLPPPPSPPPPPPSPPPPPPSPPPPSPPPVPVSTNVCDGECSGGCAVQCPEGQGGCRSGSQSSTSYNGVGYTCCSAMDRCNSVEAPAAEPATSSSAPSDVKKVTGTVTLSGYNKTSFGATEKTAFAIAMGNIAGVSSLQVTVTVEDARRRHLLEGVNATVKVTYEISVGDDAAVNAVKSAILAKPSATIVAEMKSAGLDKVTSATVTVSAPVAAPSVSAASATQVRFDFYNHAGTCAGSETSSPVTNTIGKPCDGPDADGHYNTVTVSGDKLKTYSYSDSSCTDLILTLSNCECGKCCEVYDEMTNAPIADVMLTCSIKEPDTSSTSSGTPSAPQPDINEQPKQPSSATRVSLSMQNLVLNFGIFYALAALIIGT